MSLESRAEQMRAGVTESSSVYSVIRSAMQKDVAAMYDFFQRDLTARSGGAHANPLDTDIAEVYELRSEDLPTLSLPSRLDFVGGFSYVTSHWYPIIDVSTKPGVPPFVMDELLRTIPDEKRPIVNHQYVLDSLAKDPTGATFLEEMARAEFKSENLELAGALKAITGIRKMHQALTPA